MSNLERQRHTAPPRAVGSTVKRTSRASDNVVITWPLRSAIGTPNLRSQDIFADYERRDRGDKPAWRGGTIARGAGKLNLTHGRHFAALAGGDYSYSFHERPPEGALGDFDALVLALLLMSHAGGRVVVPDLGFTGATSIPDRSARTA